MKISLVIPCTPAHFENLAPKLDAIVSGTRIPEEIVVSLSNSNHVSSDLIKTMKEHLLGKVEKFVVLEHLQKMTHGPNRQSGSEASCGDLLIYQDADDFSHPQRIEIIEYFFNNHDIVHLNHGWIPPSVKFNNVEKTNISHIKAEDIYNHYFPNDSFMDCLEVTKAYGGGFAICHAGHTSILKEVLQKVRWKDWNELVTPAEDYEFCMEVAYKFKKSMIIDVPLVKYVR